MKSQFGIGLDLGGSSVKYALASISGKIITSGKRNIDSTAQKDEILDELSDVIRVLMEQAKESDISVEVVGIGTPGNVNIETGYLMGATPNFKHWREINISQSLQKHFAVPVFADNDANVMALGEARLGAGKGYKNIICVTVGTGIGGGFIINGDLYRGSAYAGGEFGHSLVKADGLTCNCGANGCLEVYASATAMIREYKKEVNDSNNGAGNRDIDVAQLFELYECRDNAAIKSIDSAIYYLGRGIAASINLFNPEIVVIGGGVAEAGSIFIDKVRAVAFKYAMPIPCENVKIVAAQLGNNAGFLGAISFGFEQLARKEN